MKNHSINRSADHAARLEAVMVGVTSGVLTAFRVAVLGFAICGFGVLADISIWPGWMTLGVIAAIAAGVGVLATAVDTTVEIMDARRRAGVR
ncbi:hypothetical protein FB566_2366 [Stackebrandtia endophytica]|uniref:Uncharacterized protein n=1 Tax=Stackebrandtia endophytica TaxID=1496996 RepID=A0A543AW66_9ACTN|nr:hypothetical protein [Stackebrandtia endophytica]TQL76826.1 hypothetical protein FB566_2366 [Stackebrandtia endophytica]